jgi:hypothetical protein
MNYSIFINGFGANNLVQWIHEIVQDIEEN